MVSSIAAIIIGYLVGSISPAFLFGKILKGIDIRAIGENNAGTTNVYKNLGIIPAIATFIFDVCKGVAAIYLARFIGASELIANIAGLFAIIGHIFPFYLGFRGGQGAATSLGLLIYYLLIILNENPVILGSIFFLAFLVISILIITKQKNFLSLVIMPYLFVLIVNNYHREYIYLFAGIIALYLFFLDLYLGKKNNIFRLKEETIIKISSWRTVLRPLAILFPISYFYFDKYLVVLVAAIFTLVPLVIDIARLAKSKINLYLFKKIKFIYKENEEKSISSITLFFLSIFLTFFIFPKYIAITAVMYLILGDVSAKFFGSEFGKTKIGAKTLEGSLACLLVCITIGYAIQPYVGLNPFVILTGAITATIFELFPIGINDNLVIALVSAFSMLIARGLL